MARRLAPRSRLNDAQRQALVDVVKSSPIPAIHGVVRWRLIDLAQWLHGEFAVSLDETTISRELNKLGYVKLTARPRHHAQNEHAMEAFKRGACCRAGKGQSNPPQGHAPRDIGSRTKPALVKRIRSRGAGRDTGPGLRRRKTNGRNRPTSSARSARNTARAQGSSCPSATPKP